MFKITEPGIYDGLSEDVYHGDSYPEPCLSTGVIKDLVFKCPAIAWENHPALNPTVEAEDEDKFSIGNAAHALLLEGIDNIAVLEFDSYRTNAAKDARAAAKAEGKIALLEKQAAGVSEMVLAAETFLTNSELAVCNLRTDGKAERSFVWTEDGTWFKARPDWMPEDEAYVLDYKTTQASANPESLDRIVLSCGYDIQDWLYTRGVYALTGKVVPFVFLFQECEAPYLCSLVSLSPQFREVGMIRAEKGIALWRECLKSDNWPGYPSRICYLDPPAWAANQIMVGGEATD